ncbi:MAG TPA: filamentous hemagglutinin N-terminal domain-containing protein [Verrucomicrobiae bacterium]|nr:filamentous hemagglutinin N-terminal domain-containing protein [Verrucomicrobiae bacterium]
MRINVAGLLAFCCASFIHQAHANPLGGSVVGGNANATIKGQGTSLVTINQNKGQAIINWQSFSINAGEMTKFIQPSATAAILNRVMTPTPSLIYGNLEANGKVYLVNPAGVFVGPSGVINTRSFLASTFDIGNDAFRSAAALTLSGSSTASVRNEGTIQALGGDVFLIANTVENAGKVQASGTVGLAAGSKILLAQSGAERIVVQAGNPAQHGTGTGVNNQGQIQAATTEIKAAGGNIYALAINNGGAIRATTAINEGGRIYLRASGGNIQNSGAIDASGANGNGGAVILEGGHNATAPATVVSSGTIDVQGNSSGAKGGMVQVTGDHVGLFGNGLIDASGQGGGGTVLLGGDYHGRNPAVLNAEATVVGANASIRADALTLGNGGKVVLWSEDTTRFQGSIFARGGSQGGNGGFVETSSGNSLAFNGLVNTLAPAGRGGELLLDPKNIVINASGSDVVANNETFAQNPTATANLSAANLVTELANNASLTLKANNDIAIETDLNFALNAGTAGKNFSLEAGRNLIFAQTPDFTTPANSSGAVTLTMNGGDFSATYNDAAATLANRDAGTAQFFMTPGSSILTRGGAANITGSTLSGAAGDATLGTLTTSGPADTTATAGGNLSINTGAGGGNIIAAGALTTAGAALTSGNVAGNSGGTLSLIGGTLNLAAVDSSGSSARGSGNHNGGSAGSIALTANSATPSITLNGDLSASGGVAVGGTGVGGAGAAITLSGPVILAQNVTVNALRGTGNTLLTSGKVWFQSTVDGDLAANDRTLKVNTGGITEFDGAIGGLQSLGSLTTDVTGETGEQTQIGGNVTSSGTQTYNDAVVQSADSHLTGSALALGPSWDAANHNLQLTFNSSVTVPAALVNVNNFASDGAGGTVINGDFTTAGSQTYGSPVTISGPAGARTLTSTAVLPANGKIWFQGTVDALTAGSQGLVVKTDGTTEFDAAVGATSLASLDIKGNSIATAGNTDLNTPSIATSGSQTFENAVSQSAGAHLTGTTLTLGPTWNGGNQNLQLSFSSAVTVPAVFANLNNFTSDGVGGTLVNGDFAVAGSQTYVHAVTIGGAAGARTLSSTATLPANGKIWFQSTVDAASAGVQGLSIKTDGTSEFDAAVGITPLASLDVRGNSVASAGNADLNAPTVTTSGGQTYENPLTLSQDSVLKDSAGQNIIFDSTLDGNHRLEVDTTGNEIFNGVVGGVTPLISLTTDASGGVGGQAQFNMTAPGGANPAGVNVGSLVINDVAAMNVAGSTGLKPSVESSSGQTYKGAVVLSAGTVLRDSAGQDIVFQTTVDGSFGLEVDTTGNEVFNGVVGGATPLASLTTDASGGTGGQAQFNMAAPGGANPAGVNAAALTIADTAAFQVSGSTAATPTVQSTAGQTYNGAVVLNASTVLKDAGGQNISLTSTVDGAKTLEVDTGGNVALGVLGGGTRLTGLKVTGNILTLNGNINTEDAAVDFTGITAVNLVNNVTIDTDSIQDGGAAGSISFGPATAINGSHALVLDASGQGSDGWGNISLGVIGTTTPLLSGLTLKGATLNLNGAIAISSTGVIDLESVNNIAIGANITAGTFDAHSGLTGLGNITFGPAVVVKADTQSYQAGDGHGGGATSTADLLSNGPLFENTAGLAAPVSFTYQQDAAILAGNLPPSAQFIGGQPLAYVIRSDDGAVQLPALTLPGSLQVISAGDITQLGALSVMSGGSSFSIEDVTANILLGGQPNHFANQPLSVGAINGGSVQDLNLRNVDPGASVLALPANLRNLTLYFDTAPVALPAVTLSGALSVTAGGTISQSGALNVMAFPSTFTINGAAASVLLGSSPNNFGNQPITISAINGGSVQDVALWNVFATPTALYPALPAALRNLTLRFDNAGVNLPVLTLSGNLNVKAGGLVDFTGAAASVIGGTMALSTTAGGISQSGTGPLTVTGTSTLAAGPANNIALNQNNNFSSVGITSGHNVVLNDINGLIVGGTISGNLNATAGGVLGFNNLNISGNLNATANGLINDNGAVHVAGLSSLGAGPLNDIQLTHADDFGGAVTIVNGRNVVLTDVNGLTVGGAVSGNLGISAGGATILNPLSVGGFLNANATGPISDNGAVTVAGTTALAAGPANDITLNHADSFQGAVTIVSAGNVNLNDIIALTLGGTISGDLATTAGGATAFGTLSVGGNLSTVANGPITQTGPIIANGLGKTATFTAGLANDITLANPANDFTSVGIVSANNVALSDLNGIDLAASTLAGNLSVAANGPITQGGAILANGTAKVATFAAGAANDITLGNSANDFSAVSITSGNNVTLADANALILAASTVSGNFNVSANGPITQSGVILANGLGKVATFASGPLNDILLGNPANDFTTVAIGSANNVTLADANALNLGPANISGNFSVTANGPMTQSGSIIANGSGKTATFAAGAANDINLADPANDFSTVSIGSGNNVTLADANALNLGASAVSGNFNVTASGPITQTGIIIANGLGKIATFAAGPGNDVTLANPANDFTTVSIVSGANVLLADANALDLGNSTASGNLSVAAAGPLTQSGALNVTGLGSFTSTASGAAGNITLNNAANNFGSITLVSPNGAAASVNEASASALDTIAVNNGALTVISAGAISQVSGKTITVGQLASFTSSGSGASGDITLNNAGNNFGSVGLNTANGAAASLTEASDTALDTVAVNNGALAVNSAGAISQVAGKSITAGQLASFTSAGSGASGDITLNNPANNFGSVSLNSANGAAASVTEASATALDAVSVNNGALSVNSAGAISQVAGRSVTVGQLASFTSTGSGAAGDITLDNAGNNFGSLSLNSANGSAASATEASDTALDTVAVNNGALTVSSAGAISQVAGKNITVGQLASFSSTGSGASGDITLNNTGNNFGSVSLNSANGSAASVTEASDTALDTVAVNNGALAVNSAGAISQVAGKNITVAQLASFTSTGSGASGDITLNNAGNNFGSVGLNTVNGAAASLTEASDTALDTVAVNNGALTVNSAGAISQVAGKSVTVGQLAAFSSTGSGASGDITLNNAGNNFGSVGLNTGNGSAASVTEASDTALDTVAVNNGALTVNSAGAISQVAGKSITAGQLASFTSTGSGASGDITLDNAGNNFGSVALSTANGAAASVTEASDTALDTVSVNNGALMVDSAGAISQVAGKSIGVGQLASFTSTGSGASGDITLNNAGNNFGSVGLNTANGSAASVTEASDTALDTVSMNNGALTINSAGAISQVSGKSITVGQLASFTSTGSGASGNITLNNAGNNFGSVALNSANGAAASVTEASDTGLDTVSVNNGALTINSAGAISQVSGKSIAVGQLASFTSTGSGASGDITLDNVGNNFGSVSLNTANGSAASVTEASDTALDTVSVNNGALTVNSAGAISQVAGKSIAVGQLASFTSTGSGARGDITLDNAGNNFGSVSLNTANGSAASVTEASDTALDAVVVNNGALTVNSAGAISQVSGKSISVGQLASFTSTGSGASGDITLDNAGNNFGSVALNSANGSAASVTEASDTALDAVAVNNGALTVNSAGTISQAAGKSITVGQLASFTSTGSGASGDITLNNAGNNFGSVALNTANGLAASITEASDTALDTVSVNNGALTINSAGAISQVAGKTMTVGQLASFISTGIGASGDITLDNAGNNFGSVSLNTANGSAASLTEASDTVLDIVAVNNGALTLNSAGAISQVPGKSISVGQLASFTSTGSGASGDITLNNAGNNFGSLGLITANGTAAAVTQAGDTALDTVAVNNGALTVNSAGAISQVSGKNITVGQLASFTSTGSGAGGDITLNNAGNYFGSLSLNTANGAAASVAAASAAVLDTVAVNNGALSINSAAAISQVPGRSITVGQLASFISAGSGANGDITLNNAGNYFGSLSLNSVNGAAASVTEAGDALFDTVSVNSGSLALVSPGAISQVPGKAITVGTSTTLNAGGNITLDGPGNYFGGLVTVANGQAVTLVDISTLTVGGASRSLEAHANGGDLVFAGYNVVNDLMGTASGNISQTAPVSVGGSANLDAGGNITLNNPANTFSRVALSSTNGTQVQVSQSTDMHLDDVLAPIATVMLNSAAGIFQEPGASLVARELALNGVSQVSLVGTNNHVQNLAGILTGPGAFQFTDQDALTVTTVGGVPGITALSPGSLVTLNANNIGITAIGITAPRNQVTLQPISTSGTLFIGGPYIAGPNPLEYAGLNNVKAGILQIGNKTTFNGNIVVNQTITLTNSSGLPFQPTPVASSTKDSTTLSLQTMRGTITNAFAGGAWAVVNVPRLSLVASNVAFLGNLANSSDVSFLAWQTGKPITFVDANTLDLLWADPAKIGVNTPPVSPYPANPQAFYTGIDGVFGANPPTGNDILFNGGGVPAQQFANSLAPFNSIELPTSRLTLSAVTTAFDLKAYGAKIDSILGPGSIWMSFAAIPFTTTTPVEQMLKPEVTSKWIRGVTGISGSTAGPQQSSY